MYLEELMHTPLQQTPSTFCPPGSHFRALQHPLLSPVCSINHHSEHPAASHRRLTRIRLNGGRASPATPALAAAGAPVLHPTGILGGTILS
jgi:hypothetical protein